MELHGRDSIKKSFLLCCHKELTPVTTTKSLHNILKASDPSNAKGAQWWALMNMYVILESVKFLFKVLHRI